MPDLETSHAQVVNDILDAWMDGDTVTACSLLFMHQHEIAREGIPPALWALFREVTHRFVLQWLDDPDTRFLKCVEDYVHANHNQ